MKTKDKRNTFEIDQTSEIFSVYELWSMFKKGFLLLDTGIQRNKVWDTKTKSGLILTILNRLIIDEVFLHAKSKKGKGGIVYYVIDGQQRLSTIFDYMDDMFSLKLKFPTLSSLLSTLSSLKNKKFTQLEEEDQELITTFDIHFRKIKTKNPRAIREIFKGLNTGKYILNPQEMRHSQFQGMFKNIIIDLAILPYIQTSGLFSQKDKIRKKDEQFVATLFLIILRGKIQGHTQDMLYDVYGEFDDEIPDLEKHLKTFNEILDLTQSIIGSVKGNWFRRTPQFYYLFSALFEINKEKILIDYGKHAIIKNKLINFITQVELASKNPDDTTNSKVIYYLQQSNMHTTNLANRENSCAVLKKIILDCLKD